MGKSTSQPKEMPASEAEKNNVAALPVAPAPTPVVVPSPAPLAMAADYGPRGSDCDGSYICDCRLWCVLLPSLVSLVCLELL